MLLGRNFDFLGGYARYLVVTTGYCSLPSGYCSLLVVTARYRSLLLVPIFSINAAAAVIITLLLKKKKKRKSRQKRKVWVKHWLKSWQSLGVYETLQAELRYEDERSYKIYLRMTSENFEEIFQLIKDDIRKENTKMGEPIPPRLKLAATIRFLSIGESYKSLQFQFRIHNSTLSLFVQEVFNPLKEKYMKVTVQLCFGVLKTR